ncbi:uncharacterized protein LOC107220006 isoform X1 [Neodiprion lecontei]|uniref:Uncharacterized protein LOC107220006 isoform X1 n=1 Tax=Neodiprion lecontei TaxID=441921 RepID=A0ABM3GJ74_NEOLC|nr:uncharacterized protein LOC107220006 isoform X1 [Neodiprion lecontei]XP_046600328.1 uncharacterized protein LOC107220006 isoform X1 [Neodiprion lecontei]
MYGKGAECTNCEGDCGLGCGCRSCLGCNNSTKNVCSSNMDSVKIPVKLPGPGYVMQILNAGLGSDNLYEAKLLLAPEIDMSSIKITVKDDNLRVSALRSLGDLAHELPDILEKSALGDLVKMSIKHSENFLIPKSVDGDEMRAVMDNKQRLLTLTAPLQTVSKSKNCCYG